MKLLVAAAAVLVAGAALWGWGDGIRRVFRARRSPPPLTAAFGLAGVVFLGGLLNLAGAARPAILDVLAFSGVVLAAFSARGSIRSVLFRRPPTGVLVVVVPMIAVCWFLAVTTLPPGAFNFHDDFEKYFAEPVRMLATGTVAGNRLDSMGGETLGGQAFLQGFIAAHLPLSYIGAVDWIGALLLCMALAGSAAEACWWPVALVAEACVIAINPQIVNVSAVFTGAALVAAATLFPGARAGDEGGEAPLLGLLYAGMIALKSSFAVYFACHLGSLFAAGVLLDRSPARSLQSVRRILAWTALFIAPWVAVHLPLYLAAVLHNQRVPLGAAGQPLRLFSVAVLYFGATQLDYTMLAIIALLAAGVAVALGWLGSIPKSMALAIGAGGAAAGLAYFLSVAILGPAALGQEGATRYACPILIGSMPSVLALCGSRPSWAPRTLLPKFALTAGAVVVVAFLPSTETRIRQAADRGNLLAFDPRRPRYFEYSRAVLAGPLGKEIARIQRRVPRGQDIVAWIMNPYWLDFRRNRVFNADLAGIGMPWAHGITARYYIWEYRGPAVRPPDEYAVLLRSPAKIDRLAAARALEFLRALRNRLGSSDVLYDDGWTVVFRVRPGAETRLSRGG